MGLGALTTQSKASSGTRSSEGNAGYLMNELTRLLNALDSSPKSASGKCGPVPTSPPVRGLARFFLPRWSEDFNFVRGVWD